MYKQRRFGGTRFRVTSTRYRERKERDDSTAGRTRTGFWNSVSIVHDDTYGNVILITGTRVERYDRTMELGLDGVIGECAVAAVSFGLRTIYIEITTLHGNDRRGARDGPPAGRKQGKDFQKCLRMFWKTRGVG